MLLLLLLSSRIQLSDNTGFLLSNEGKKNLFYILIIIRMENHNLQKEYFKTCPRMFLIVITVVNKKYTLTLHQNKLSTAQG